MSKSKDKSGEGGGKKTPAPRKRRGMFLLFAGAIIVATLLVALAASGWLLAQAARWPVTEKPADLVAPVIPAKVRAPGYRRALSSDNPRVREKADEALEDMGPEAQAAISDLVKSLKSREAEIRRRGLEALGRMGRKARDAGPQITTALRDKNAGVRAAAARALARIRARADVAIPALREALNDSAPKVREAARLALERIERKQARPNSDPAESSASKKDQR